MTEEELKKARLEFLEETIKFYSEDTSRRTTEYRALDGRMCAIGRHLVNYNINIEGMLVRNPKVQQYLPESILNLGVDFLQRIQSLHDLEDNWDEKGITKEGLKEVNEIKSLYT